MTNHTQVRTFINGALVGLGVMVLVGLVAGAVNLNGCGVPQPQPKSELAPAPKPDNASADADKWAEVAHVVDGDTIDVRYPGVPVVIRVRLLCIDTPERGEPGFKEATDALAELIGAAKVRLEFDETMDRKDSYGRTLAYVMLPDGRNANVEMTRLGWTDFYTKYGHGDRENEFFDAVAEAHAAGRGIWKEDQGD